MCNGVLVPALLTDSVLIAPPGAPMVRLLMVIVDGKLTAVLLSMVAVFELALVIKIDDCPLYGATPRDQLVEASHLPLTLLVQLFVLPAAITISQWLNSVVPLPVAVMNIPGGTACGTVAVKLPPASVVTAPDSISVWPSP